MNESICMMINQVRILYGANSRLVLGGCISHDL